MVATNTVKESVRGRERCVKASEQPPEQMGGRTLTTALEDQRGTCGQILGHACRPSVLEKCVGGDGVDTGNFVFGTAVDWRT